MLVPVRTTQFKRDVKLVQKQGKNMSKLKTVMTKLIHEEQLEIKHQDHKLSGDYKNHRECHIEPNWLLIYRIVAEEIHFVRTGSHSELFNK
jgi:mRNA interferase YafQ